MFLEKFFLKDEVLHTRSWPLGKVVQVYPGSDGLVRYFLWPGMSKDLVDHCGSCKVCQLKSKYKPRKAPVVERPILTEPFESVAVDLVGLLPKGRGGCKYLLTCVCMATRWPETVPLRSITAKAVSEGSWSIFSRTGRTRRCSSVVGW